MRLHLLSLYLLLALFFSGCAPYQPNIDVNVKVERLKEAGTWRVTYDSSHGFTAINFARQRYKLRTRTWRILTEGVSLRETTDSEQVVASKPIRHFEAEFDERPPGVANDYPIVSYYSDGGAVLYTGHLMLKIPDCDGCHINHSFEYVAPAGDQVITEENNNEQGDFVYFGQHTITEYDSFRAVTDDGLPDWIKRQIERSLPTFIVHYQDKLGFDLSRKPLVFLAYDKGLTVREEGYLGGVVGSHMQLVLVGNKWTDPDGVRYEKFAHLIAHEVFHLWNGALFLAPDRTGGSWLHEGSADAIADYALFELGYYGDDRYHEIQTERLNQCMLGLSRKDLPSSDQRGFYKNFYECGAVMNHMIERKLADGLTLFDLWRSIFQSSVNSFYSHDKFFDSANAVVTDQTVVSAVARMANGSTGEPSQFMEAVFDALSIKYSVVHSGFPAWYENVASRNVVSLLAERDCGSTVPVDQTDSGVSVQGGETCSSFKNDRELRSVVGYTLPTSGAEAYDSLYNHCATDPVATASDSNGNTVVTSCHDFPKRPDFINW